MFNNHICIWWISVIFTPSPLPHPLPSPLAHFFNRPPLCSCLPFVHSLHSLVTWQNVGRRLFGSKHKTSVTLSLKKMTLPLPSTNWRQSLKGWCPVIPQPLGNVDRPKCSSVCLYWISIRLGPSTPTLQEELVLSLPRTWWGHLLLLFSKRLLKLQEVCKECRKSCRDQRRVFENDSDSWKSCPKVGVGDQRHILWHLHLLLCGPPVSGSRLGKYIYNVHEH